MYDVTDLPSCDWGFGMTRKKRNESLASNLALLLFMVTSLSLVLVSVTAIAGVVDLATRQASARQIAYQQALIAEMHARIEAAQGVVSRVSTIIEGGGVGQVNRVALAMQFDAGIEFVDTLIVADIEGRVLSAHPTFKAPRSVAAAPYFPETDLEGIGFHFDSATNSLWISRLVDVGPEQLVLMARVRTAFIQRLVDEFSAAEEGRVALLLDPETGAYVAAPPAFDLSADELMLEPGDTQGTGSVSGISSSLGHLVGHYALVSGYDGIGWTVIVMEPQGDILYETWQALAPATMMLLLAGLVSTLASFVFLRRQVSPIRALEVRARQAVIGAHVAYIDSDRKDELGSMADAFDAMAARVNSLNHLGQLLASSANLDQVLDAILTALRDIVRSESVAVFLLDDSKSQVAKVVSVGVDLPEPSTMIVSEAAWLTKVIEADRPVSFIQGHNAQSDGQARESSESEFPAGMAAPLKVGADIMGVVVAFETGEREFTDAEIEIFRTFTAHASVAVHNSRLFENEIQLRQEAESLREIAALLTSPRAFDESYRRVTNILAQMFDADDAHFVIVDRGKYGLPVANQAEINGRLNQVWESANRSSSEPLIILDRGQDTQHDELFVEIGAERIAFLGVLRGDAFVAFVALKYDRWRDLSGARVAVRASALSSQLSLVLDNAYYFAEATTHSDNLETIFRISQVVGSSLQPNVVLNRVLDVVQKIFGADAVALLKHDDFRQSISTVMARGSVSAQLLRYEPRADEGLLGAVFSRGLPIRTGYLTECEEEETAWLGPDLESLLAAPLIARGRTVGVLAIFSARVDAFSEDDMELLSTFASQAALAIDTANMYGREHHVATVLKASILPDVLPEFEEVEADSLYLPAGKDSDIGGDYYDLMKDPEGRIVIVIGDVCGKGVEAATKTSMIKYSARALIAAGLSPREILAHLNRLMIEPGIHCDIVTLWIGRLDPKSGLLEYANGGHPPALVWRAAVRKSERLCTTGPLLGAFPDPEYEELSTKLDPGDSVLLYTDGVTESRNGNRFFGEGRVRRALSKGDTPSAVIVALESSLRTFTRGELRDDAAAVVVRLRDA